MWRRQRGGRRGDRYWGGYAQDGVATTSAAAGTTTTAAKTRVATVKTTTAAIKSQSAAAKAGPITTSAAAASPQVAAADVYDDADDADTPDTSPALGAAIQPTTNAAATRTTPSSSAKSIAEGASDVEPQSVVTTQRSSSSSAAVANTLSSTSTTRLSAPQSTQTDAALDIKSTSSSSKSSSTTTSHAKVSTTASSSTTSSATTWPSSTTVTAASVADVPSAGNNLGLSALGTTMSDVDESTDAAHSTGAASEISKIRPSASTRQGPKETESAADPAVSKESGSASIDQHIAAVDKGPSKSLIAGLTVSIVLLITCLALAPLFWKLRKRRKLRNRASSSNNASHSTFATYIDDKKAVTFASDPEVPLDQLYEPPLPYQYTTGQPWPESRFSDNTTPTSDGAYQEKSSDYTPTGRHCPHASAEVLAAPRSGLPYSPSYYDELSPSHQRELPLPPVPLQLNRTATQRTPRPQVPSSTPSFPKSATSESSWAGPREQIQTPGRVVRFAAPDSETTESRYS